MAIDSPKLEKDTRVLVFPAGTEVGLEIHRGLTGRHDLKVVGASGSDSHAPYVFSEFHEAPHIGQPGWLEKLKEIVRSNNIDLVYPAHDEAVFLLSQPEYSPGVPVITSPGETCSVCRYKSKTYELLKGSVPIPNAYLEIEKIDKYPVFVKPDRGQGSRGASKVSSEEELRGLDLSDKIILDYLPGEEFTIDCFSDREKGLLFARGRVRRRVNGGISVRTEMVDLPEFCDYAEKIQQIIKFHGAWFFQVKYGADKKLYLLEVAPRIAGSMAYYRVQGVNFPLLSVYEAQRKPYSVEPQLIPDLTLDRALYNRYSTSLHYDSVYIDLDDTLIVRNEVNTLLARFIYQCVNKKKPVCLITRHKFDLNETLKAHRLTGLFDQIIHLKAGEPKSAHIKGDNPIFIDDSFSERAEVSRVLGIRSFDPSILELLLNDRI
jgi:hypothetical protein